MKQTSSKTAREVTAVNVWLWRITINCVHDAFRRCNLQVQRLDQGDSQLRTVQLPLPATLEVLEVLQQYRLSVPPDGRLQVEIVPRGGESNACVSCLAMHWRCVCAESGRPHTCLGGLSADL